MLIQPPIDRWRYRNDQQAKPKDQQHGVDHVPHFLLPGSGPVWRWSHVVSLSIPSIDHADRAVTALTTEGAGETPPFPQQLPPSSINLG